jgi:serine/threonine protein kinase
MACPSHQPTIFPRCSTKRYRWRTAWRRRTLKGSPTGNLKPGNILVTGEGRVKILDFGLAQVGPDTEAAERDDTLTLALTDPGTAIGTVPYMSPEQARGLKVSYIASSYVPFGIFTSVH